MVSFRERDRLSQVVVINVSSTEPLGPVRRAYQSLDALEVALARKPDVLPPSSLYAYD
ncbi:inositol-3-phosphate synthase [Kitasatospora aureofaciens]|uniref:inositol-3-phosphate synthase n=1 Tax=Kitasatospora aureofaciens TaxID=1894 RepID=UPI0033F09A07